MNRFYQKLAIAVLTIVTVNLIISSGQLSAELIQDDQLDDLEEPHFLSYPINPVAGISTNSYSQWTNILELVSIQSNINSAIAEHPIFNKLCDNYKESEKVENKEVKFPNFLSILLVLFKL